MLQHELHTVIDLTVRSGAQNTGEILREIKLCDL